MKPPGKPSSKPKDDAARRRVEAVRDGYARGWSFTPLAGPQGKKPTREGWQAAPRETIDEALAWAAAGNVGLRTGTNSGVVVIDIDNIPEREAIVAALPKTVTVVTARGGRHLYYAMPDESMGNSSKAVRQALGVATGVDVRGTGGQVVFVGGRNYETGGEYRWAPGLSPDDVPVAPFPVDLLTGDGAERQQRRAIELAADGWSQRKIACELKVGPATVNRWLTRSAPRSARSAPRNTTEQDPETCVTDNPDSSAPRSARSAPRSAPGCSAERSAALHGVLYNTRQRWARAAFDQEIQRVREAPEGARNNTLNEAAFNLGTLVASGDLDRGDSEAALEAAALATGLEPGETAATIRSGLNAGLKHPRQYIPRTPPPPPHAAGNGNGRHAAVAADSAEPPTVILGTDEHRVVDEVVAALRDDQDLYCRGGVLVRIARVEHEDDKADIRRKRGTLTIERLPNPTLRLKITRHCRLVSVKHVEGEPVEKPAHPPAWLTNGIETAGEWPGIRSLTAVSDAPPLRRDGTLHQTPGYDPITGVFYAPAGDGGAEVVVPDGIGLDDAQAAAAELEDLVCDFSFEASEHRAAWLASLLTPLARPAFSGPSPLFLFDANVRGSGKTMLAQIASNVITGRDIPASSYTADPDELRKRVTAIAISGDRMILLDNIEGVFGNDTIDRALTSTNWKDRILGRTELVDMPLLATWYGTGNNVIVAADTARRIIHVRLDVLAENPEDRSGFKYPDVVGHARRNRPRLLAAALTLLSAYLRSGDENRLAVTSGLKPFGSFEGWSNIVRAALVWAGLDDPCLTRAKLATTADSTAEAIDQVIDAFRIYTGLGSGNNGVVITELLARLYQEEPFRPKGPGEIAMRAALETITGLPPGKIPSARQVGNKFKQFRRRVRGNYFIDVDPGRSASGMVWRLYKISDSVYLGPETQIH